jgi:uncharacterized protein (DUF2267 family)
MPKTGLAAFDTTVDKTNHMLHEIEAACGWPRERRNQSYAALRAVLHALRDRMTVDEAAEFAAQLPMLVRGFFFEGWDPSRVPMKMDRDAFFARVRKDFPFALDGNIDQLIQRVLAVVHEHVTDGEWQDILSIVPKDMAAALPREHG